IWFLSPTGSSSTGYIDNVKVYSFDTPGYYGSSTITAPYYITAVKPYWNLTTPTDTTAWINISRDGGTTWNQSALINGQWYTFPSEVIGDQLCYNLTMKTTNIGYTPVLADITIYYIYCNPPDVTFVGESPNDKFGYSVHGAGDIGGDGIDDIIIGAPYNSNGSAGGGAVYIFNGSATLSGTIYAWNANYTNYSYDAGSHFGWSVCKAGDLDCDGNNDIAIGAPHFDVISPSMADAGKAWIMSCFCPIPEFSTELIAIFIPFGLSVIIFRRRRKRNGDRKEREAPT
ncbi:MAG: integrin alpha, partial [Candidatus Thermoplasmatota archaeon]|nr:integrin alpha [Candidatus Thermoplasmatota archaeon]